MVNADYNVHMPKVIIEVSHHHDSDDDDDDDDDNDDNNNLIVNKIINHGAPIINTSALQIYG